MLIEGMYTIERLLERDNIMSEMYEKIKNCVNVIRSRTDFVPKVALVLGSGLGGFADKIRSVCNIDYKDIDGFPCSTVSGHDGKFIFGYVGSVPVVAMKGRVHYYEGYDIADVVLPIRVMKLLGAEKLILTNAAGGINKSYKSGEFMLLKGHISSFVPSPLRGENIDELGPRFPDMSEVYDSDMRKIILNVANELRIPMHEGVYIQTQGPNYETPEEIKAYAMLGADAVGMSTSVEAIVAKHMGMRIAAISCISNMAAGISKAPLSHEEVKQTADQVSIQFEQMLEQIVAEI